MISELYKSLYEKAKAEGMTWKEFQRVISIPCTEEHRKNLSKAQKDYTKNNPGKAHENAVRAGEATAKSGYHQTKKGREDHARAGKKGGKLGKLCHEDAVRYGKLGGIALVKSGYHKTDEAHKNASNRGKIGGPALVASGYHKTEKAHEAAICRGRRSLKFRIQKIEDYDGQFIPAYNLKACKFFVQLNNRLEFLGYTKGIHAENKGEFKVFGLIYRWVDWYHKDLNVVIEWDESKHYINGKLNKKDVQRQKEIVKILGCRFIRIKQGEENLEKVLRKVIPEDFDGFRIKVKENI